MLGYLQIKVYKPLPVDVGHAPYISQATVDLASDVVGICISITGFDNLPQCWCCDCCLASTHSSVTWIWRQQNGFMVLSCVRTVKAGSQLLNDLSSNLQSSVFCFNTIPTAQAGICLHRSWPYSFGTVSEPLISSLCLQGNMAHLCTYNLIAQNRLCIEYTHSATDLPMC